MMRKAIFFDRDDTLIFDTNYMYKVEDLEFIPEAIELLKELRKLNYIFFIVTNQSGIGRGFFDESDMHQFNKELLNELEKYNIKIEEIVFCPHSPEENCACRKPSPKLINELCDKYNINKSASYMVGDKESDILAGKNAGLKTFYIEKQNHMDLIKQFIK